MSDLQIISRAEARAAGLKKCFTGRACKNGHVAERYVVSYICVTCNSEKVFKRYWANPEAVKANVLAWRAENREKHRQNDRASYARHKAERSITAKAWRDRNPERIQAYAEANKERKRLTKLAHRQRNSEKIAEYGKAYRASNGERIRMLCQKRRARRLKAEGNYVANDVKRIYAAQKGKCAYCRQKLGDTYQVDHIVPLALGGSNWPSNLQCTCPSCNRKKNAKAAHVFAREMGMLL